MPPTPENTCPRLERNTMISISKAIEFISHWEGRTTWAYLDSAERPNVTIGVGCLIKSVEDYVKLPLKKSDGSYASDDEKSEDFFRIISMPGSLTAKKYKGPLELSVSAVDDLTKQKLFSVIKSIPNVFPRFEGFPYQLQYCLLDLAWNCGLGQYPGLLGWSKLRAALRSIPIDWAVARNECTVANPNSLPKRGARNAWRVACVDAAANDSNVPPVK